MATACITGTFRCQLFIPNRLGDERRAAGMGGVYVEAGPFIEPEFGHGSGTDPRKGIEEAPGWTARYPQSRKFTQDRTAT